MPVYLDTLADNFVRFCASISLVLIGPDFWPNREEFAEFLLEKHRAYTAEPLTRWGYMGIVIRIDSKVARAINLWKQPHNSKEPVGETLEDIVGYCVLADKYLRYIANKESQ